MGKTVNTAELAEIWGVDEATIDALARGEDVSLPVSGGKIVDRRELAESFGVPESVVDASEQIPGFPILQMSNGRGYDLLAVMNWCVQRRLKGPGLVLLLGDTPN